MHLWRKGFGQMSLSYTHTIPVHSGNKKLFLLNVHKHSTSVYRILWTCTKENNHFNESAHQCMKNAKSQLDWQFPVENNIILPLAEWQPIKIHCLCVAKWLQMMHDSGLMLCEWLFSLCVFSVICGHGDTILWQSCIWILLAIVVALQRT